MSDLSPKSDPKRTLLSPSHLITIYEYTPASMARFLKGLYREAGISGASSHSGRRTLITRRPSAAST
jgi:hypothetical protein